MSGARRLALAYTNPEPIQGVLPHAEADKTPCQPFFKRAANVQAGGPEAKTVLLTHAAFCEVFVDGTVGTCLASADTIRALCEMGRRRFWKIRGELVRRGALVPQRRQAGMTARVHVLATPDLIRLAERPAPAPEAPATSERRSQGTFEEFLSRYPRGSHLDVTPGGHTKTPSKKRSAPRPPRERARAVGVRTAERNRGRAPVSPEATPGATGQTPEPEGLDSGQVAPTPDRAPGWGVRKMRERQRKRAERLAERNLLSDPGVDVLTLDAEPLDPLKSPCGHCGERIEGENCPDCGNSNHEGGFRPSADRNEGGD